MATQQKGSSIDPKSGFCSKTKSFHSLRPRSQPPPQTTPLSLTDYLLSRLHHSPPLPSTPALLDASTGHHILYPEFIFRVRTLAASLQSQLGLSHGQCAFVLSPNSLHLPILHLSLLSLGVIVSPSNPTSSNPEISHQISICRPTVAFTTTATAHKIPNSLRLGTIILDSPEFESMMLTCPSSTKWRQINVSQSTATILYSSGTTGRVKGVELTHRNWITNLASSAARNVSAPHAVCLCTAPFFHVYGFAYCLRVLATGDTLVWMTRFDMKAMLRSIERFGITHVAWAPPWFAELMQVMTMYVPGQCEISHGGACASSLPLLFLISSPCHLSSRIARETRF